MLLLNWTKNVEEITKIVKSWIFYLIFGGLINACNKRHLNENSLKIFRVSFD